MSDVSSRGLWIGDPHFRGDTVSCRRDDFLESICTKLDAALTMAEQEGVDYVGFLGDIVHVPEPTGGVRNRILDILMRHPSLPKYLTVGNHDVFGHNTQTLYRTAVGTLVSAGAMRMVDEEPKYGLYFGHYHDGIEQDVIESEMPVWAMHAFIMPKPFVASHVTIDDFQTRARVVVVGHYHPGYPITVRKDGVIFACPGSLGRTSLRDAEHEVCVTLVEVGPGEPRVEYLPVPGVQPASVVFDMSVPTSPGSDHVDVSEFVQSLSSAKGFVGGDGADSLELVERAADHHHIRPEVLAEARKRILAGRQQPQ